MPDVIGYFVKNTHGTRQIDQNYKNRAFRGKATVTTTATFGDNGGSYVDVALSNVTRPVVALRCAVGAAVWWMTGTGTSRSVRIASKGGVGTSITYYWFDVPAGGTGSFGRIIRNPTTLEVTFDSRLRYMVYAGFHKGINWGEGFSQTYVSGRTYAAVQSRTGYWSHAEILGGPIGPPFPQVSLMGIPAFKAVTNGLAQDDIQILAYLDDPPLDYVIDELDLPADLLAIDVTGL